MKEKIRIRVIGLVWEDTSMHWSKNGNIFTPEELALNLKMIVSKQRSHSIPIKPPVLLSVLKALQQLDTQAPDIVTMDAAYLETSDNFDQQARRTIL